MTLASILRRRDARAWTAAAALTLAAVGLAAVWKPASPAPSVVDMGAERVGAEVGAAQVIAHQVPPDTSRLDAFRARMLAFTHVEPLLWRAFFPPTATPHASVIAAGRRLKPGATPQACLTQAVYYEARGEPLEGQAAVAQVVLNRTRSGAHPSGVCGVVFEGAARPGCQFSFACDTRLGGGRTNAAAWRRAETVASAALAGQEKAELRTAMNYHADYVHPRWADRLQQAATIGRHIFYAAFAPARPPGWSASPASAGE